MTKGTDMQTTSGIGLPTILFVVFLVLKLTGVVEWAWVWVFAPLWIPLGLAVTIATILFLGFVVNELTRK